jgi:hypothetical protein
MHLRRRTDFEAILLLFAVIVWSIVATQALRLVAP